MRYLALLVVLILTCGNAWGAKDDVVYKLNTASTKIATSATYQSYGPNSCASDQNGSTLSSAYWYVTCGSMQTAGLWLGSNKNQKAKMILSTGDFSEASAIATAIGVATSDTYYAALVCRTNMSKVYKVTLTYTTPGGTAPSEAWILYSTDNGSTWSVGKKVTSLNPSGTDFVFDNTITSAARYAFVIHCEDYCQFKVPVLTFYEGTTGGTTYTVTYDANGGSGTMTDSNSPYASGATVTVLANGFAAPSGKVFSHWDTKADDSGTDYDPDGKFTISANTTLYAQWIESGGGGGNEYVKTNLTDIGPKDVVVIIGNNGSPYAMSNDKGTSNPPSAVGSGFTIDGSNLTTNETNILWNIDQTDGSISAIYPNGTTSTWLYCTKKNNGVRVGTNENKTFTIDAGYLKNTGTNRYVGIYNSNDWRCYESTTGNIANQTFSFYVQKSTAPYVTLSSSFTEFTYEYTHGPSVAQSFTVSGANLNENLVVSAPTNYEVCKTAGGTYTSSVEFTPSTGTVSEQTVYIRLAAGKAVGEYNYAKAEGLAVTSIGADDVKAALTGSVTPQSFTVTATSSNVSHGTVSPASQSTTTNMTITASPVAGYRVISGAGGYTVTTGTATVVNNGDNTFTVTPSTDCTVQINFEAIPTHKVKYWASGTIVQESDVREGAAIPDQSTETAGEIEAYCNNRDHFVGWTTNSSYSHATDAPDGMITTMSPGGTMGTSDVNYYAVFANTGGVGSTSFSRVTSLSQLADGDVIIIVSGSANEYILQQTASGVKSGGARTATTSFTDNTAANHWTLEKVDSNWKLCKDASNKLTSATTPAYTANGNSWTIEDSQSDDFYFIRSGTYYLEYYNSGWKTFQITGTPSSSQNAIIRAAIYKQDPGHVEYTTQCCALKPVTGVEVSGKTGNSVTLRWTLPSPTTGIEKFQIIDVDNANAVVTDGISTSATSATVTGLIECNTYHYKVVSYSAECTVSSATVEAQPFGGAKTVTFNYNSGTGTPASFTTSCGNLSTTLPAATRDGYTFLGWWTTADGGSKVGDEGANYDVATTTTIHAHWAQNFSVYYNRRNGTAVCSDDTWGAGLLYTVCTTEPTRSGYIFAGWDTEEGGTGTRYNAGGTFIMPSSDVTLYAQWTANWRNLTFNVPSGGGSITGGPSGNRVLDNQTFTFPNITGKSDAKWCWTFLGWTETAPNGSGTWATTPSYIAGGATSGAITSDKTYYAVYSKTGAGASGDVYLTNEIITAKWADGGNAYGNSTTITAGGEWTYTGYGLKNNTYLQLKDGISTVYLKTPAAAGNITTITINYTAVSVDTRIIYCNTSNSTSEAVTHQFNYKAGDPVSGNHDVEIDVSSLESTSIYIGCNANIKFNSVSFHYGPRAVYGYTLDDCGCQVTQFNLTYNANSTTFPGSTISCSDEVDYVFASHGNEYTFCSAPTPPTGYRFLYWAENANGTGNHWEAGETVSCLPSADLTVYAFYERVFTVTFDNQGTLTPVTQASAGATIAVPSASSPCSPEWAFVGWSETAIAPKSLLPTLEITAGEGTYTPTADKTLYAIYQKTSESSPFVAGMSGAYKISNGSTVYAGACNNNKLPETDAAGANVFYIKYTSADGGKYTIQQANGKYVANSGSATDITLSDDPCYWSISKNANLWSVQLTGGTRYLRYSAGTGFKAYNTNTTSNTLAFVAAEGQYYYRTMSCAADFDVTFHDCGTTINWAGGYPEASYKNLADATVISTFPTATYSGWTFLGWRTTQYEESTDAPASSSIYGGSDGTSGNTLTIPSTNVDLYPVFTQFEDNEQIDLINGGDYYIYFLDENQTDEYGAYKRVYATSYSDKKRYSSTSVCSNATEFTFTKLANGNWTIYDKTTTQYLYGVAGDALKQQASATGAEWTLTLNGNEFDAFHVGTEYGQITAFGNGESATFMNYSRTNIGSNPSYHRVYLGTCTNRTFTYSPSNTPNIEIHGDVKVTSTAGKSVKATSVLTVSANNISTANLTVTSNNSAFKFSLIANGSYTTSVNIPVVSNRVAVTPVYIEYTPTIKTDGIEDAIITVSDGAGTPTTKSTADGDVQGRHLPTDFVIAAKIGNNWYALPADCSTSTSSTAGVLIEVDNLSDPTRATGAPMNTKYGLQPVRPGRVGDYGSRLVFTEHLSTATTEDQKTLYNGETTSIQVNAMYKYYADPNPNQYEWIPTTTDLKDYTLTSAKTFDGDAAARTVSLNTSGVFGTLLQAKAYNGKVRLLPATFYEPAEVQILKWKTNSVIVMYTGTDNATTKVGENDASDPQALGSHKLTQGIYEFTTDQSLTENAGQTLRITLGTSRLEVEIPLIIAGNTTAAADGKDVVILDGATFTAAATKYNYRNVYVYGGGKLDIPSGKSLGVNNIILRAGGITTSGIGSTPVAMYEYKYPQVKLVGELTSTQTNIKYEYVTDYDHWYHLCLPFDASYTSVSYPQEYYGSNVAADNHGSWVIKRYDGATRATGNYDAWVDIETDWKKEGDPKTVYAGHGYIFWGAPKKVTIGGDQQRQAWGIQRMTMAITSAAAATTAETNDKNISVDSYSNVNNPSNQDNDRGWNLVGNPYMVNLTDLSSNSLIAGKLVHTETNPWDGKWMNNGDGVRYVTIPDNNFDSYVAKTASMASGEGDLMPGRAFFVQIAEGASTLTFAAANRASLTPARFAQTAQSVDIETGIVMSDESKHDEVNFWIKEDKSAEYEYNADYPKTPNKTNFNIYGVHQSGNLSWVAISPAIAESDMAIGYQVPAAGDYTLSLSEKYIAEEIESVFVTDHGVSPELTTDLMVNTYTFTVHQAETNNERFTVSIKVREKDNTPTDIGNSTVDTHAVKFIRDDKMYILRNGLLYDATGKRVTEINK